MRSIPLALTWEFWRRTGASLLVTIALLSGMMAVLYGGLRLDRLVVEDSATFTALQIFCFIFVVVMLSAVVCEAAGSLRYRFALPVSTHASIFVPMINAAIATAIGYLTIALFINWSFNARWSLLKPTITAVCMVSVCHAVAWLLGSSSNLRAGVVAIVSSALGVFVIYLSGIPSHEHSPQRWQTLGPFDIALAILVPVSAYTASFVACKLARRGQILSMSALGRWLLAKLDVKFNSAFHAKTPLAAELWADWATRGRVMPAGALILALTLCGFFLTGRFDWNAAGQAIAILTWFLVTLGSVVGLYLGHVGERFDFHEHLATRPLSDIQLADVKLLNALKSVMWTWTIWILGVALAVVCLTLVGQGPKSWSEVVPPGVHPQVPVLIAVMVPLGGWTLTSFCVSVAILRPWMLKTLLGMLVLLPALGLALQLIMPKDDVPTVLRWIWNISSLVVTISLFVVAYRLRVITARRIAIVGVAYPLFCAVSWFSLAGFLPPPNVPLPSVIASLFSTCILPFASIAAVPLAIWWNRHR